MTDRTDEQSRPGTSRRLASLIVVLLVLSVPWYFPAGDGRPFVFSVPLWCFVSLGCYVAIAAIVAARLPRLWDETNAEERWRR